MKRILCVIVFAAAISASAWSVDWKARPATLPQNSILTDAQAGFGSMNWDISGVKSSLYGSGDLSADYALPVRIPLTVGLQLGMGGASIKDWKGGIAGWITGPVTACYNTGAITLTNPQGYKWVMGYRNGNITACYYGGNYGDPKSYDTTQLLPAPGYALIDFTKFTGSAWPSTGTGVGQSDEWGLWSGTGEGSDGHWWKSLGTATDSTSGPFPKLWFEQ
jgi:hypothetical protein